MPRIVLLLCILLLPPALSAAEPHESITDAQIAAITYEDAQEDGGITAPLAANLERLDAERRKEFDAWIAKLDQWPGLKEEKTGQKVRNALCLAALVDIMQHQFEAELPYVLFERLKKEIPKEKLIKAAAWVVLKPEEGQAITKAPELGFEDGVTEEVLRERASLYAKKLLGRLLGKLPVKE